MASTTAWFEYNDPSGTITETAAAACNWQNGDAYQPTLSSLLPITSGTASFWKIQSLKFTNVGSSAAYLSSLSYSVSLNYSSTTSTPFWKIMAAVPASGTFFLQPLGGTNLLPTVGGSTPISMPTSAGTLAGTWGTLNQSWTANSSTTGPFTADGTGTMTLPAGNVTTQFAYATALYTQLQTGAAGPGSIGSLTITATWTES